ncbi:hypothetical protein E0Z10_g10853 [Xylaria hypoxylon]|uniref:Uncharacterized protein n=1 Tax=Xylaria hypoxylon TaxID=37992 RepID=A0A4Z0XYV9_9PEZI|nr:hypothetical protein E0Z10_g10853 [Xylaria hypoxylon]
MNREPYAWRYPAVGSLRALDRQATYPEYPESNSYKNYTPDVDSSDRVSYARRSNPGYDNARINRYGNSMTHHEWETQRFAPVGPPISSSQSYDDQRVRQGSNSCWAPGYTSSINAHERNSMPYDESNREQMEQGDHGYRGNIYGENGLSSDEESQYEWDACYPGTEEVGDYSYAYQDSNYFDDEYEENPDQYAGDDGFDSYSDASSDDDDYSDDDY